MPAILLRGLAADLVAAVRAYATRKGLSQRDAAERLIRDGLDRDRARQAGGAARHAGTTADERSAAASRAAHARWARRTINKLKAAGDWPGDPHA